MKIVMTRRYGDGRRVDVHVNRVDPDVLPDHEDSAAARPQPARAATPRRSIVSESLAPPLWPGEDPLGKAVRSTDTGGRRRRQRAGWWRSQDPDAVEVYYLAEPADLPSMVVLVRTVGPAGGAGAGAGARPRGPSTRASSRRCSC